jgi:hypothetical protein
MTRPADAVDLHSVIVHNSPADIADWPVTRAITRLTMRPSSDPQPGLIFEFDQPLPDEWEWLTREQRGWQPGDSSSLENYQCTVWALVWVNSRWHASGYIQLWKGLSRVGAPILSDFHANWAYDSRWGDAHDYIPASGDAIAFFVSAGNARGQTAATSRRERSNVVGLHLPIGDSGVFDFAAPIVQPPAPPAPGPTPAPVDDVTKLLTAVDAIVGGIEAIVAALDTMTAELKVIRQSSPLV